MTDLIQCIDTLTEDKVKRVLECLNPDDYIPTTIFGFSGCEINKDIRSNERICLFDEDEAAKIIHEGMNQALLKYRDELGNVHHQYQRYPVPGTDRTNSYRERIQILRYQEGQHYTWHYDEGTDKNINEYHRTISIVLYLTDDFSGGRTCFPHRCYKPRAGQALIFPSNWCFPHQSEPIVKGEKIVAVTWYHSHYNFDV